MVVKRRKPEIFIRERPQALEPLLDGQLAPVDLLKQLFKPFWIHGYPFSSFASRSIRSLTALRQDLFSYRTALIS
jgi:hypothetical protein